MSQFSFPGMTPPGAIRQPRTNMPTPAEIRPEHQKVYEQNANSARRALDAAPNAGPEEPRVFAGQQMTRRLANSGADWAQQRAARGSLAISADPSAAKKVLEPGGEFKNQYEVQNSNGMLDPWARANNEAVLHGYEPPSRDIEGIPSDRPGPVFGYVRNAGAPHVLDGRDQQVIEQYGSTVFNMKPSVRERTTLTFGDSLGGQTTAERYNDVASGNVDPREFTGGWGPKNIAYLEAQVHGKHPNQEDTASIDTYPARAGIPGSVSRVRESFRTTGEASSTQRTRDAAEVHERAEVAGIPYRHHDLLGEVAQGQLFQLSPMHASAFSEYDFKHEDPNLAYVRGPTTYHYRTAIEYGGGREVRTTAPLKGTREAWPHAKISEPESKRWAASGPADAWWNDR